MDTCYKIKQINKKKKGGKLKKISDSAGFRRMVGAGNPFSDSDDSYGYQRCLY